MLRSLTIENYALIRSLKLDFDQGLTVITGETGAGKSILLGALALILGKRADHQVLQDKSKKCIVEGCFYINNYDLNTFFEENELDYDDLAILRREILPGGRSRAFINDTPVGLNEMKELGDKLVNIHSQHETTTLNNSEFQLAVIDNYAGINDKLNKYRKLYKEYIKLKRELYILIEKEKKQRTDLDYYNFQLEELSKANLVKGEQEELEEEQKILEHAEEIKSTLYEATNILQNNESNVTSALSDLSIRIGKLKNFASDLDEISGRIDSALVDLNDLADSISQLEEKVIHNPERQEEINERLDLIYQLEYKHRAASVQELIKIKEDFEEKTREISSLEDRIKTLGKEVEVVDKLVIKNAEVISKMRLEQFTSIEKAVIKSIQKLGMPHGQFKILHQKTNEPGYDGIDKVQFLFNANKGGELASISKIASGGELSRLMLSIKSLISIKTLLPTIIFDEIDSGVSGEVADRVGGILRYMSSNMQVIAITHLPQIAGKGIAHFKVSKETDKHSTFTVIQKIDGENRVSEIAQMLSGENITDSATETAKQLINRD